VKAMAKGLTYEEFIEYAQKHYCKGGDTFVECWDKKEFDYFVKNFGEITKRRALSMFRLQDAVDKDREGFF
jgi:hypothetical protein